MSAVAAAVWCAVAGGPPAVAQRDSPAPSSPTAAAVWTLAPAYEALFAPRAHRAAYQFFTSPHTIDALLGELLKDPASVPTPGGWTPRALLPLDAFGRSGDYDRTKLARLYSARRVQVARGPRQDGGAIVESWTLVSPYPDPALTRLEPGTLLIVLRLP